VAGATVYASPMRLLRQAIAGAFTFIALALMLYGAALWSWQVYRWLQRGDWFALPAALVFQNLSTVQARAATSTDPMTHENMAMLGYLPELPRPEWMDHPREWLGLHRAAVWALDNANIGFCAIALGVICLVIGAWLSPPRHARLLDERMD
jgi:hypothetical protein